MSLEALCQVTFGHISTHIGISHFLASGGPLGVIRGGSGGRCGGLTRLPLVLRCEQHAFGLLVRFAQLTPEPYLMSRYEHPYYRGPMSSRPLRSPTGPSLLRVHGIHGPYSIRSRTPVPVHPSWNALKSRGPLSYHYGGP